MRELIVKIAKIFGVYNQLMKVDHRISMKKQNKAFSKYGLETLRRAEEAADKAGCTLFLAFGSLLGAYREKGFIPHDIDLDAGMLVSERTEAFVKAMEEVGLKHIRQYYVKSTGRICEDKFDYKGVHIDIFYFYPDNEGNICCDLCLPHETKDWRTANQTDGFPAYVRKVPNSTFSKQNFLGIECYMPDATEDWLKVLYGEHFMTPNPKWTLEDHKKRSITYGERLYRR